MKSWKELKIWQKITAILGFPVIYITLIISVIIIFIWGFEILTYSSKVPPYPLIKSGDFSYELSYELNGKTKTIAEKFSFEYEGIDYVPIPFDYVNITDKWNRIPGSSLSNRFITTNNGKELYFEPLVFDYRMRDYFMSSYKFNEKEYGRFITEPPFYEYDEGAKDGSERYVYLSPEELEEKYGIKIIKYELSPPIRNIFIPRPIFIPDTHFLKRLHFKFIAVVILFISYCFRRSRNKMKKEKSLKNN